jgi:predicted dehydrogenase
MKQLFQNTKEGAIKVEDVPSPTVRPGTLLVHNHFSAISPGTERGTVRAARSSYVQTARARPELVRRVIDLVQKRGVVEAYLAVQQKLSEPVALGYSTAGVVLEVGEGAEDHFKVGDRVACAGQGVASHAEQICVPVNLAAPVPDDVSLEHACFATIGAIALHGVRQAEIQLGDRVAVIGLGIVGLMTVQLVRAHGGRVAAFDLSPELVTLAKKLGAEMGSAGGTDKQVAAALSWSQGLGVDKVLVTASSTSSAPMVSAAGMARDRARVVAVGGVPFGLPREIAYPKELELRISRSYGPGRYDRNFEERGIDYPAGYVRWTETRNLESFIDAVRTGSVVLDPLITHRVLLDKAPAVYDLLLQDGEQAVGMVIEYPKAKAPPTQHHARVFTPRTSVGPIPGRVGVGFVGAGSFARTTLLPAFAKHKHAEMIQVANATGLSAKTVKEAFGFRGACTNPDDVIQDPSVDLVCIATRHDLHASLVIKALRAGKHVFVEKPLALDDASLSDVLDAAESSPGMVLVGFNRRFAPMSVALHRHVSGRGPTMTLIRVNGGSLAGHWLNDPHVGGGRLVGEGCHFVDLCSYFANDAVITDCRINVPGNSGQQPESFAVQLSFADGSIGQICYSSLGDPSMGKERVEVFSGGVSGFIDDFKSCQLVAKGRASKVRTKGKGHSQEVGFLIDAVKRGGPSPIPLATLAGVTRATFNALAR